MNRTRKSRPSFSFLLEPLEPRQLLSLAAKLPTFRAPASDTPNLPVSSDILTTRACIPFLGVLAAYSDSRPLYSEITESGRALAPRIDWGDGTGTRGTLVRDASGRIHQYGPDHVYTQPGHYTATLSLYEEEISIDTGIWVIQPNAILVASRTLDITVLANPVSPPEGIKPISGIQGYSIADYIATIARPGAYPLVPVDSTYVYHTANENDLEFHVDWGDDEPSFAKARSSSDATYDLSAQHTYQQPGTYTVTIKVIEAVPTGPVIGRTGARMKTYTTLQTLTTTATIAPFPPGAYSQHGAVGSPVSGLLAAFDRAGYPDVQTPVAILWDNQHDENLRVIINWGDGTSSLGLLNAQPLSAYLQVQGSHAYTRAGTFPVTLSIFEYVHSAPAYPESPYIFQLLGALSTSATITGRGDMGSHVNFPSKLPHFHAYLP